MADGGGGWAAPGPDARTADHWDASWAVSEPGAHGLLARTRFTLSAAPHGARAWVCAAGLWPSHPLGLHSAAPQPPLCLLTVNGVALDVPPRLLVRGEALAVDLTADLVAGVNDVTVEAAYHDGPTLVGLALPVRLAVFCQLDVTVPGEPLTRIASGRRPSLPRIMPFRPALASSAWDVLVRREPQGRWQPVAEPEFLHPLVASPLLRLPRRPGALEHAADRDLPRLRHTTHVGVRARGLAPGAGCLVDFAEELVGHLAITTDAPAALTVSPGESEPEARDLEQRTENPLRRAVVDAPGTWRDRRRSALRCVLVRNDGRTPVTVDVALDAVAPDLDPVGRFHCSDAHLDAIWAVGQRTVLRCTHDYVEDGPKRDRLLWLGDLAVTLDTFATTIGTVAPARRSLLLAAANQLRNGAVPGVGPHPNDLVVADYVPHLALAAERLWWLSGDAETAVLLLPTVRRTLQFLRERISSEGLVGPEEETDWWVFLDWNRREPFGSPVERTGHVTALSLLTVEALRAGARLAAALGDAVAATRWATDATLLAERVAERCLEDDARGLPVDWVRGGERSRHASRFTTAWALRAGVGTSLQRTAWLDALAHPGGRLAPSTTGYGQHWNVDALFRAGRADAALALVRRWWGGMLARGATTFWESFEPSEPRDTELDLYGRRYGTSLCHGWSGTVSGLLSRWVLGVEPLAPGAARVAIAPQLGDLAWAEGVVATPRGPITVRWADAAHVDLPAGVEADVTWRGSTRTLGPGTHALS